MTLATGGSNCMSPLTARDTSVNSKHGGERSLASLEKSLPEERAVSLDPARVRQTQRAALLRGPPPRLYTLTAVQGLREAGTKGKAFGPGPSGSFGTRRSALLGTALAGTRPVAGHGCTHGSSLARLKNPHPGPQLCFGLDAGLHAAGDGGPAEAGPGAAGDTAVVAVVRCVHGGARAFVG